MSMYGPSSLYSRAIRVLVMRAEVRRVDSSQKMTVSDYCCFMGRRCQPFMSIKMVLRKSRNDDLKLIMIRVIPGHSTVLRLLLKFGFAPLPTAKRRALVQARHRISTRDGLLVLSGLRHYHKKPPEFGHFHFFFFESETYHNVSSK